VSDNVEKRFEPDIYIHKFLEACFYFCPFTLSMIDIGHILKKLVGKEQPATLGIPLLFVQHTLSEAVEFRVLFLVMALRPIHSLSNRYVNLVYFYRLLRFMKNLFPKFTLCSLHVGKK